MKLYFGFVALLVILPCTITNAMSLDEKTTSESEISTDFSTNKFIPMLKNRSQNVSKTDTRSQEFILHQGEKLSRAKRQYYPYDPYGRYPSVPIIIPLPIFGGGFGGGFGRGYGGRGFGGGFGRGYGGRGFGGGFGGRGGFGGGRGGGGGRG